MSDPNTAEINFLDNTQMIVPIKNDNGADICYTVGDYVYVYDNAQVVYTIYPWRDIKNVKFTP